METQRICPSCRKPLPPDVPLGLCPECLLKSGLGTGAGPADAGAGQAGSAAPSIEEIARLFPQFEILDFIGKGGMGAVYRARQPALGRFVALKILPPAAASDPGFAERFNREARALASLNHPNIVTIHDFGQAGPLHYLVMEFVDGGNLRQVEAAGRLAPEQALAIIPQICEALQFAHNEGIVHRDIKPENILLDKKGRVKITDFGIAKILGQTTEHAPLTGARDIVGTPHYMAPEQVEKPQSVDHRADIYSLGVVFYEMLTGELPLGRFAPPSRRVQVDVRLDEVVLHALEKQPEQRYQRASQVKTAVETIATSAAAAPPPGAEAWTQELLARDYTLDIQNCLRRGWRLVWGDFWPVVGVTALILVLLSVISGSGRAASSEGNTMIDTSGLGLLLSGPLMGGLYLYFLKKIRGEIVRVETAFSGFTLCFLQLLLGGLVTSVLTGLGIICLLLPGIFLWVAWLFTLPLIIDQRLEFWPAMRLSLQVARKHWWKFFCFVLVLGMVNLVGLLSLCVGFFVAFPVSVAAMLYAYEDIFRAAGDSGRPAFATAPKPAGPPPVQAQPAPAGAFVLPFAIVAGLVFVTGTLITLLMPESYLGMAKIKLSPASAFRAGFFPGTTIAVEAAALSKQVGSNDLTNSESDDLKRREQIPPEQAHAGHPSLQAMEDLRLGMANLAKERSNLAQQAASLRRAAHERPGGDSSGSEAGRTAARLESQVEDAAYDPHLIQTECEVIRSQVILSKVIENLDLGHEWGKRYAGGKPLNPNEALAMLLSRIEVSQVRNTSLVAIRGYSDRPDEAARIANEIALDYQIHNRQAEPGTHPLQVEIIDRASAAIRPIRPNKPLNLFLAAIAGLVLGTVAGAVSTGLRSRTKAA
jgi:capsular polysaccharide biosynthesis protein